MSRRRFARVAALSAGAALFGCAAARSGTTLEFWTISLSPWFDEYVRGVLSAFEQAHPGVRVVWVDVPFEVLERKLIAAAAAGRAPDVVNMSDVNFARFASFGAFKALDALLPGSAPERYLASALDLCRLPDASGTRSAMGLPWYVNPQTAIVNAELLGRGGLTVTSLPATWAGLLRACGAFHRESGQFLFSQPLGEESQIPIMMLGDGVMPLRAKAGGGLEADLTSPESLGFLEPWVEAFRAGWLPRAAGTSGHAHLLEMYQAGRVAVISTGPNFLKRVRNDAPKMFGATTVRPGITGRLNRTHMPVMPLGVLSSSPNARLAAELAWFVTSPENQTAFCKLVPIMPSTRASLRDPFFTAPSAATSDPAEALMNRARAVTAASMPTATAFTASLPCWPDLRRRFEEHFKRVLLDGVDLRRAMRTAEGEWNELLAGVPSATMDAVPRPAAVEAVTVGVRA